MTFLNAILAIGTLAFTIPLIIHLLNRSRYRTVDWGAMIFLEQQLPSNSRQWEWKNLLLLFIRCSIPVFLALAMARPFLNGSSWVGTKEPMATVVIIDDSLSMQSKSKEGGTRWTIAIQQTEKLLKSLPQGSESRLVLAGGNPELIDETDLANKFLEWNRIPSVAGRVDVIQATKVGLDWLNKQPLTKRQLIYVSDFQTTDWSSNTTIAGDLKRLVDEQILPPMLSWLNVSGQASTKTDQNQDDGFRNYSIGEVLFTPKWMAENQLITAICSIHNHSSIPAESIAVSIRLDDQALDSQKINIAPKSSTRITTKFKAPQSGWHLLSLSTHVSDDLEIDNFKKIPFLVQSRSQVLLIDGDQRTEPMQSETDFLRIALSPFTFSQNAGADYFDTKIIGINQVRDASLNEVSTLAICNVSQLDAGISNQLREFAEEGGGVILFLGDRIDADSWNRAPTIEQGGIRFFAIENSEKVSTESNTRIVIEGFESSLFRELSQSSLSSISAVTINRYSAVSPLPESKSDTISRLNNDHPWILRHDLGKGAIWVVTTSCDTADTNLPMRPVYVPLMQRLFHAVSRSEPAIEVSHTKTPWRIRFARKTSETKLEERLSFRITPPRGTEQTSDEGEWPLTRQVGLYEAKTRLHDQEQVSYCWMDPSPFAEEKNVESTRSDITRDELLKLAEATNAICFDSMDGILESESKSWGGREIGSWFWLAALACFIAEMLVAQSFSTRRSSARAERTFQQTSNAARGLE